MDEPTMLDFARRFFAAVAGGDLDAVRAFYAPDAVIWMSHDEREQGPEENLAVLGWIKKNVRNFRYEDARCQVTPAGFVEQHTTCGQTPSGAGFRIPACIVVEVVDGRITRLEEYIDAGKLTALL